VPKKILIITSIVAASAIYAADSYKLQEVTAVGNMQNSNIGFETENKDNINSQGFNKNSIETFGKQTNMSALEIIDMSPSVNFESIDSFGSNESSYHDAMRIRGKNQSGPGGVLTIEGLPINSNPGGGKTIYDMDNFSAIDLYKGYVPVDKGFGFSNLIGKVDMTIDRPKSSFGGSLSQMLGSENTSRTYLRLDTGKIGNLSAFGSVSDMSGDKWKGDGDLKRTNGMVGLTYTPTEELKTELFVTKSRDDHYNYYQMSYAEARNLSQYNDKDYGLSSKKSAYDEYNKQDFEDLSVMANIEYKLSNSSKLVFKPYYLKDNGEYWYDTAPSNQNNTMVAQWLIDHELFGAVAEYEKDFSSFLNMKLGYWAQRQQPPGPPTDQRKYNVSSGAPVFAGYMMLARNGYHDMNSPFIEFSGDKGGWSYSAGIRYLTLRIGALNSFTNGTSAATSVDYNTALANATFDAMSSVRAKTFTEALPSAYIAYAFTKNTSAYLDYTRSYGYDVNLFPFYVSNRATYAAKGVTLQQLWDKQNLEISDNFDLGVKYRQGDIVYTPNLFVTKVSGKQVSAYDPVLVVSYPTNNADAMSYGAEFTASGALSSSFDFMASASYNKYYYTDNIRTSASATDSIKGNQIPDAPEKMLRAAVTYKLGEWKFTPIVKFTDKRYGDVDNTQMVPAYTLVDFDASYTKPNLLGSKEAVFRLTVSNLFNRKYIAAIITPDNAMAANTTSTFYQSGAPLEAYLSANFKF